MGYLAKPPAPRWRPGKVGTEGARLFLPLARPSSTLNDLSGWGNNGTVTGAPTWSAGPYGWQLGAFSSTAFVNLDSAVGVFASFPFYLWALVSTTQTNWTRFFCFKDSTGSLGPSLEMNRSTAGDCCYVLNGVVIRYAGGAVNDGQPRLFEGVSYAGNDHRLYVNGVQVAASSTVLSLSPCVYGSLGVLRYGSGQASPLSGSVAAAGAGAGPMPDPARLAADLLPGRFSAVRPRLNKPAALYSRTIFYPAAVGSAESFGTSTAGGLLPLAPGAVGSAESFGAAADLSGSAGLDPAAVASGESFGVAALLRSRAACTGSTAAARSPKAGGGPAADPSRATVTPYGL